MTALSKDRFKQYLERDKEFLRTLYVSESVPNTKRVLMFANDQKLDTLIKLFHFITNGVIKIKKSDFDSFKKSQVSLLKKNFETKASVSRNLKLDRQAKMKIMQKLAPILSKLIYPLFNSARPIPHPT